jgi:hypothetical protein
LVVGWVEKHDVRERCYFVRKDPYSVIYWLRVVVQVAEGVMACRASTL